MKKYFVVPAVVVLMFSSQGWASGISKPVIIGAKAIGMGGAFTAVADDPTAIFHNPAGITQLKGHHFYLGMDSLLTKLDYTPPGGSTESAKKEFLPVPNFAYTTDIAGPVHLGVGVYFPHGNGGKFDSASAVVSNPLEGRIYSLEIAPTAAMEIVPGLSLGASLRVVRIQTKLKGQLLILPAGLGGGTDTLDDFNVKGWGVGASAGLLAKPADWIAIGANYRSKVKTKLDGDGELAAAGAFDAEFTQILPTLVTAGVAVTPIDILTIALGYGFEHNSEIKEFVVSSPQFPTDLTLAQNWKDSHTIHVGVEARPHDHIAIRAGYARDFNESIPDTVMNRITGDIDAHETSVGLGYIRERYSINGTWNARFGKRDVPVDGTNNVGPGNYDGFVQSITLGVGYTI
ncbi:MAG: outer membrane protein transport protein [Bdellovibrionales bacterium]|nr:outer membrane protein transport protein [Bdellovibrionales bacterium]